MSPRHGSVQIDAFKKLIDTPELPDLGPGPRSQVEPLASLRQRLDQLFSDTDLCEATAQLLRGAALLWHDHHEEAHRIAQEDQSADGSFLHGVLHRREPDYSNAKYWFRQVGKHDCFPILAQAVSAFLREHADQRLQEKLLPRDTWDPFGFIELCAQSAPLPGSDPLKRCLREIQALEFDALVQHLFHRD